ncbi:type II toxin-antitoxin system death-on-curing family toxin [Leptospira gomenensis]|uniref:Type II toxin-antitoxin system death-on-curing family toxin n=1 Tax=Leptospira gomenensis TaxID=2484974 RepID=A0A5F1YHA8_9LEPT|nr:type II toxin-antitoxin system death-on-curing family toxin [Leptospira gomenensis]TGK38469.1 type II toxin-antitoxin system death-on-curing family toxin [Leptospira gomenensis]TGK42584.1 type II toxin-antitoxin system death-on-curing family toxin [Leptospira gomenensis]TGK55832.1 type II toxin-antitoxin system death-on-curing family toxin [Leptospira gomenensis]
MDYITFDEAKLIHQELVNDFIESGDPIFPSGIKDINLLESAIYKQQAGFNGNLLYNTPISNAAALCYGITSNHAFHNGNKRAGLVALMCHLYKNGITFKETNQKELYNFILDVASHNFSRSKGSPDQDIEIAEMTKWIKKKTRKIEKGDRVITFRKLREILKKFDIVLENPMTSYIDVVKITKKLFGKERRIRLRTIPYHGEGSIISKGALKNIRESALLTEEHGVDSATFYGFASALDAFIVKNQTVLKRLAKT